MIGITTISVSMEEITNVIAHLISLIQSENIGKMIGIIGIKESGKEKESVLAEGIGMLQTMKGTGIDKGVLMLVAS